FHARRQATDQESQDSTRRSSPSLRNRRIPRAGVVHRPEIAKSHAQERSTAQKSQNPTRRSGPPLGKSRIPRAGAVHRSGKAESHAREKIYRTRAPVKTFIE